MMNAKQVQAMVAVKFRVQNTADDLKSTDTELQSGDMKPSALNTAKLTTLNQLKAATTLVLCLATAECVRPTRPVNATPVTPNPIPSRWVDLPEAPFVAQVRDGKPALVARSRQTFSHVAVGCVVEVDGKAHVIVGLIESLMTHGAFGPNRPETTLISSLTNPDVLRRFSQGEHCPPDSYFAVTGAVAVARNEAEEFVWNAEGTAWTRRK